MTKVNALSIDTLQSTDLVADASNVGDKRSSGGEFSRLVDSQIQTQQKSLASNTSRAGKQGKIDESAASNAHTNAHSNVHSKENMAAQSGEVSSGNETLSHVDESSNQDARAQPEAKAQASDQAKEQAAENTPTDNELGVTPQTAEEQESKPDDLMSLLAKSEQLLSGDAKQAGKAGKDKAEKDRAANPLLAKNSEANKPTTNDASLELNTTDDESASDLAALIESSNKASKGLQTSGESEASSGKLTDKPATNKLDEALATKTSQNERQKIDESVLAKSASEQQIEAEQTKNNGQTQSVENKVAAEGTGQELAADQFTNEQLANAGAASSKENSEQSDELPVGQGKSDSTTAGNSISKSNSTAAINSTDQSSLQKTEQVSAQSINTHSINTQAVNAQQENTNNLASEQTLDAEQRAIAGNNGQVNTSQQGSSTSTAAQRTAGEPSVHVQQLNAVAEAAQAEQQEQNLAESDQQAANFAEQANANDPQATASSQNARMSFAESFAAANAGQTQTTSSIPQSENLTPEQIEQLEATANRVVDSNIDIKRAQQLQTETINVYRRDFADAVKDKVMVMVNQKLQQVDIQLDPPELGNVHVRVNLQGEQAAVNFTVQNPQAKDALEQHMDRLRDMLQETGVDVGGANVEQQQQGNGQQQGRFAQGTGEDDMAISSAENIAHLVKPSATGIDFYA